ncbi:hypothetical protein CI610_01236 [invertebrate metagenome]|uniref:Uncharacterized protein n=1 Tax=invertebrate metagenome TaxID=1711999 RepID=A0A2H9T943_9ZZZZ
MARAKMAEWELDEPLMDMSPVSWSAGILPSILAVSSSATRIVCSG